MTTFDALYRSMLTKAVTGKTTGPIVEAVNPHHLDCLLHPESYAPVLSLQPCTCGEGETECEAACLFQAIVRRADGTVTIDPDRCAGCARCIQACHAGNLTASRDILPALDAIKHAKGPVYALIAPAFLGQFSPSATPGKLRAAFKQLGFTGMVEVALFADLLTLKEALEFDRNVKTEEDFQLTSCCCPMWIAMIRKIYHELMPHVPGAVSPMIAAGRTVKQLHPDALTIFVGPCIAKKAEAREPDLRGAVDYVLTFQEVRDIFVAAGIRPEALEESARDHSSRAGRIYARTGGVSEAVRTTVERLHPDRSVRIRTRQADGVPACKAMIEAIAHGDHSANFFEGMGCVGGCVGGPKVCVDREISREHVNQYGDASAFRTPLDNPYVLKVLHLLGFETVETFLEQSDIFIRHF